MKLLDNLIEKDNTMSENIVKDNITTNKIITNKIKLVDNVNIKDFIQINR